MGSLMSTILDPELQCPLLHHGLVHLHPSEISVVYAACVELRETIEGEREWLGVNCRHVWPHSYGDVPAVDKWSGRRWHKDGKLHRGGDLLAIIRENGAQEWYQYGKLHRDGDLPAVINIDGTQEWHKDGKLHRDGDRPAVTDTDGIRLWFKNGERYFP